MAISAFSANSSCVKPLRTHLRRTLALKTLILTHSFLDIPPTNLQYYVDNHDPNYSAVSLYAVTAAVYNIQYDGTTVLLTAETNISANVTYHIKIAIADYGDSIFDSAVFIKPWSSCQCQ